MPDNLLGVPATLLPTEPAVDEALAAGTPLVDVVTANPSSSLAWALLADDASRRGATLESYAYARVGYHRGLDALRRAGWRGQGPIPWSHEGNRGVLRSLYALRRAAAGIGEDAEVDRLTTFITDSDPAAIPAIEAE